MVFLAGSTFDIKYHHWSRFPEESISDERSMQPVESEIDVILDENGYVYHWDNDTE